MTERVDERIENQVATQRAPSAEIEAEKTRALVAFWNGGVLTVPLPSRGSLLIGRGSDADVQIEHPTLSRCHARLTLDETTLTIEDLGSTNGTLLDGVRLDAAVPTSLSAATPIQLGAVRLHIDEAAGGRGLVRRSSPSLVPAQSSEMARVLPLVDLVARSSMSIVLLGETGVGKEGLATRVHQSSPRANAPLLKVNCAALVESLLEAELFGHERGAFTGAVQAKEGLLESANGGTLFLDELGEMPLTTQAKLLRVLESGEVVRVGGVRPRRIDVRFVAATNRDLRELVAAGRFREDLFFRLDGVSIQIPPLRARRDEILALAQVFADQAGAAADRPNIHFTEPAKRLLLEHDWPGNIRELRNVVRRSVLLGGGDEIDAEHLHFDALGATPQDGISTAPPRPMTMLPPHAPAEVPYDPREGERRRIAEALAACVGNQTRAAKLLGVSRRTLINRLDELGFPRPRKATSG